MASKLKNINELINWVFGPEINSFLTFDEDI